jgi:hypothetical protein
VNSLETALVALAAKSHDDMGPFPGVKAVQSPDWPYLISCEDCSWVYLIPDELVDLWPSLSLEAKLAVYVVAAVGSRQIHASSGVHTE